MRALKSKKDHWRWAGKAAKPSPYGVRPITSGLEVV